MQIFLDEVSGRHPEDRIVMVLDGAGWHRSKALVVPENMRLLRLPPYSPEPNPVENVWEELREKFFGNVVFDGMDAPGERLLLGLGHLEKHPETTKSISAWSWIIKAIFN
jgi:transposase